MRTLPCVGVALLLTAAAARGEPITEPTKVVSAKLPGAHALAIEKLFGARAIGQAAFSPDGKSIAFVGNLSGRRNLWLIPADGGWPTQLTVSQQRQADPAWAPDGKWIAYVSDFDGDEQWDLFMVSPITGQVIPLTNTPDAAEVSPAWSPDGKLLVYAKKPKSSPTYELEVLSLDHGSSLHLTSGTPRELGHHDPRFSPDGRSIAWIRERVDGKDSDVLVARLADEGPPRVLTRHEGERTYSIGGWSPDSRQLLITTNAESGYDNVALLDVADGKLELLTHDQWEVSAGGFAPDGKTLTWVANVDGNADVYRYSTEKKRARPLGLPPGMSALPAAEGAFTRDGRLLFFHDGPDSPRDLWVQPLAGKPRRVTSSLIAGLRAEDLIAPSLVHYPSRDGKWVLSAFVWVPYNLPRVGLAPAVVLLHGGPTSQAVNAFHRVAESLASEGYVVIAPNHRGSTGYGKAFLDANRFDPGGAELDDVLGAADFVEKTGFVDRKKLVLMGGGCGDNLTMRGLAKAPERWAAGVALECDPRAMADPAKNRAPWPERSPLFAADQIAAPLLLLAGGHDSRCPKSEAQAVYDAVKKRGGTVEMKVYENEGHGFARVENQIDAQERLLDFLKKHVPPRTP